MAPSAGATVPRRALQAGIETHDQDGMRVCSLTAAMLLAAALGQQTTSDSNLVIKSSVGEVWTLVPRLRPGQLPDQAAR